MTSLQEKNKISRRGFFQNLSIHHNLSSYSFLNHETPRMQLLHLLSPLFFKPMKEGKRKRKKLVLSIFRQARLHKLKKFDRFGTSTVDQVWNLPTFNFGEDDNGVFFAIIVW
jgi:hypothetical protein